MTLTLPKVDSGTVYRGYLTVVNQLPTGASEQIPLIIAEGITDGPTLWITGAIHGNEVTGMAVCQDVIYDDLPSYLSGTVVSLPNLNPAGLRRHSRTSYYNDNDPNRKFPNIEYVTADAKPGECINTHPPDQQKIICRKLFDLFVDDADVLLDMHTTSADAVPFVIKDRVLYDRGLGRTKKEAKELAEEIEVMADKFGLPVVFESVPEEYIDQGLQCSAAGSALNQAGISSLTIELGTWGVVEDEWLAQGVAGIYRVMEHLGMIEDASAVFPDRLGDFPSRRGAPTDYQVRRHIGPRTGIGGAGIVRHEVSGGDVVEKGEIIAQVVPPNGEPDEVKEIRSNHAGWIIQRNYGLARYENDTVAMMAIKDEGEKIATPAVGDD